MEKVSKSLQADKLSGCIGETLLWELSRSIETKKKPLRDAGAKGR